jgi:hypothetical protein
MKIQSVGHGAPPENIQASMHKKALLAALVLASLTLTCAAVIYWVATTI